MCVHVGQWWWQGLKMSWALFACLWTVAQAPSKPRRRQREREGGHFLLWLNRSAPTFLFSGRLGRNVRERRRKEKKKMEWYMALSIDRSALLIREWRDGRRRRKWKGRSGGEWSKKKLCLGRRATRGRWPHQQLRIIRVQYGRVQNSGTHGSANPGISLQLQLLMMRKGSALDIFCFSSNQFESIGFRGRRCLLDLKFTSQWRHRGGSPVLFSLFPYGSTNTNWQTAVWLHFLLLTQFNTLLRAELVICPPTISPNYPWIPFGDNGSECMGTSLWLGIAMRSIWRRPSPFLSSADQLSTWELPLPGSPSKLSPGCLWVSSSCHLLLSWVPSRNPGKKTKHSVLPIVGASMEAQFPLQFFTLKETAGGAEPPLARATNNRNSAHVGITGRMIWWFKEVNDSGHIFEPSNAKPFN